jgi:hypothetical protein
MAEIFNNFDRQTETRFLTALGDNRESAERIKTLMFTFDDLVKLDPGSAQTMRHIEKTSSRRWRSGRLEPIPQFFMSTCVDPRRQDAGRRHGRHGTGAAARRRRAQVLLVNLAKDLAAKGRDRHLRRAAKRADLLMAAPARFDVDFAAGSQRGPTITLSDHAAKSPKRKRPPASAATPRVSMAEVETTGRSPARSNVSRPASCRRRSEAIEARLECEAVGWRSRSRASLRRA